MINKFIKWFKETFKSTEAMNDDWQKERQKINRHHEIQRAAREIDSQSKQIYQDMLRLEEYQDGRRAEPTKYKRVLDRELKKRAEALKKVSKKRKRNETRIVHKKSR